VEGRTLDSIADVISDEYSLPNYNKSRAHKDFLVTLANSNKLTNTEVNAYRRLEELRLDLLWSKLLPSVKAGDLKAIEVGCKLSRAKSQLMGLDASNETIVLNSIAAELNSVLDDLQKTFDAPTYQKILLSISGRNRDPDVDIDEDDD